MGEWHCRCADLDGATICEFCYQKGRKGKAKFREESGIGAGHQRHLDAERDKRRFWLCIFGIIAVCMTGCVFFRYVAQVITGS